MRGRELFLGHLALLERVLTSVGRRIGPSHEVEDFASWAKLRLIENDYGILDKFEGRSAFPTFLHTVVANLGRDYRISRWGKWRPSAAAKRLGALAVELETALVRDGLGHEEALSTVLDRHPEERRETLEALAGQLPDRAVRRFEGEDALARLAAPDGRPDGRLVDRDRRETVERAEKALQRGLSTLDPEDRWILAMRFREGLTVARIAALLDVRQRLLYSRIEKLLQGLRRELEAAGVSASEVADVLGWEESVLDVDYRLPDLASDAEAGSDSASPSH